MTIIAAYWPPKTGSHSNRSQVEQLKTEAMKLMNSLPRRSICITAGDFNTRVGLDPVTLTRSYRQGIGPSWPEKEAGHVDAFHSLLEHSGLAAINTYGKSGPTYHAIVNGHPGRLDYILVPEILRNAGRVVRTEVMSDKGAKLQIVKVS